VSVDTAHAAPAGLRRYASRRPAQDFTDAAGAAWRFHDNAFEGPATPLVLLPGALGDATTAWQVADAFDAERRVVAVTYPGGLAPEQLADGLDGLLAHLRTGPVALWGSSYGAWWAETFALRHASQVAALWLGNTFVDGADVAASPLFDADWLDAASPEEVVRRWHAALASRPDDALRAVQLHMLHHGLPAAQLRGRLRQVARSVAPPRTADIANTVVQDCDDDPTIAPAVRERVRRRHPRARSLTLATGGHYPHVVAPQPLVAALRTWLA
jgi:maspardin